MKYLKKFQSHTQYDTYINGSGAILPNVSLCVNENDVHYNPYVETRVVAKFNVTDTSSPTQLCYSSAVSQFSAIEIDGVVQTAVTSAYTFDTLGEHTVKYTLADPTSIGQSVFSNCTGLTSIDIPDSVTSIGYSAFYNCTSLTSIDIPDSVTTFANSIFWGCYNLSSANIPNGVQNIPENCFYHCAFTSIGGIGSGASLEIPNSVLVISQYAFQSNNELTTVVVPDTVKSIGKYSFNNCKNITDVYIGDGVVTINDRAFDNCISLSSVTFGKNSELVTIGESVFGNTDIDNIVLPETVKTIGRTAFSSCENLLTVNIGSQVTNINDYAFYNSSSLTSITVNAVTPPTLQNANAFDNTNNCPIYVPSGSVDTYKAANRWSSIASRIQPIQ